MALAIVRNDITKMHVDAVVNSTNEYFKAGGLGVDMGINYAAGPRLKEALSEIGSCPSGSAVITAAFGLSSCKYIIHTVGPVYIDGAHGERALLESCYRSVLALARENFCRSLAVPLISAGACGYPKAEAYSIATACIRNFLLSLPDDEDLMVYLVLFDPGSVTVSEKMDTGLRHFISDADRANTKARLSSFVPRDTLSAPRAPGTGSRVSSPNRPVKSPTYISHRQEESELSLMDIDASLCALPSPAVRRSGENYEKQDLSFADMCEWWCKEKGLSKSEFYARANINKSMFWSMKHHPEQIPKKTNALACVIGLRLDYAEAVDLLRRAGMTFSKYYETDLIVEYFIRERNYSIDEINLVLYQKDLSLLGCY